MNFHQTKGREADQVILLYRAGDYLADRRATEPFAESSRVLYVVLTRARERVVVLLPRNPHQLIAPFADFRLKPRRRPVQQSLCRPLHGVGGVEN